MAHDISNLIVSGLNSTKINGVAIFIKDDSISGYRPATAADLGGGQVQLTGLNRVGISGDVGITGVLTANTNLNSATINSQMIALEPVELLDFASYSTTYNSGGYSSIRFKIWNNGSGTLRISEYTGATGSLVSSNLFTAMIPPSGLYENNIEYFGPVYGWYANGSGLVNATIYYSLN